MSKNSIIILTYYRHKLLDVIRTDQQMGRRADVYDLTVTITNGDVSF
jgi:hypothetical protein